MDIKTGWQTTEFWLTAALLGLVVLNSKMNLGLEANELLSAALGVAGYAGSRAIAKRSNGA